MRTVLFVSLILAATVASAQTYCQPVCREIANLNVVIRSQQNIVATLSNGLQVNIPIINGWAPKVTLWYSSDGTMHQTFDFADRLSWDGATCWTRVPCCPNSRPQTRPAPNPPLRQPPREPPAQPSQPLRPIPTEPTEPTEPPVQPNQPLRPIPAEPPLHPTPAEPPLHPTPAEPPSVAPQRTPAPATTRIPDRLMPGPVNDEPSPPPKKPTVPKSSYRKPVFRDPEKNAPDEDVQRPSNVPSNGNVVPRYSE